jgi:hypothetical protein
VSLKRSVCKIEGIIYRMLTVYQNSHRSRERALNSDMNALARTQVTATGRPNEVEEDFKIVIGITKKRVIYFKKVVKTIFTSQKQY